MNTLKNDYRVAAIQTVSSTDPVSNMQDAATLIAQAADDGAQLIALPEYFCFMGRKDTDKLSLKEAPGNGPIQDFLANQASRHGIWLVGGTLPLDNNEPDRIYHACLFLDQSGKTVARYDKIHFFGIHKDTQPFDE